MAKKHKSGGRYRGRNNNNRGGNGRSRGGGGRGGRRRSSVPNNNYKEFDIPDNGEPLPLVAGSGVLEMHPNGYGFLRDPSTNFTRERSDPFVPGTMIEKFGLT